MKLKLLCFLLISFFSFSQEKEDLFSLIEDNNKQIELLPEKMIFTQSLLWGRKWSIKKNRDFPTQLRK